MSNSTVPEIRPHQKPTRIPTRRSQVPNGRTRLDALKDEVASLKQGEGQRGQGSRQQNKIRRSRTCARRGMEEDAWRSTKIQEVSADHVRYPRHNRAAGDFKWLKQGVMVHHYRQCLRILVSRLAKFRSHPLYRYRWRISPFSTSDGGKEHGAQIGGFIKSLERTCCLALDRSPPNLFLGNPCPRVRW